MGSEQIESTVNDLLQIFLCSRNTVSRRNQTVGKFPRGTANWPFCLPLGNILSNSDFEFCRGKGLAHIWEVVIIKTAQTIPPSRFCHGFQLQRLNESSLCFIRNYASEFQLPEQHDCRCDTGSASKCLESERSLPIPILPLPTCVISGKFLSLFLTLLCHL